MHKVTSDHRACLQSISQRSPVLRIPHGGNVVALKLSPERVEWVSEEFAEGLVKAMEFHDKWKEARYKKVKGGPRGEIKEFSRKSRQRLLIRMASIDFTEADLPVFLTLTYPTEWSEDPRQWKKDLNVFLVALSRKWPEAWGVWKLELQKRGAPHYHLLLWDGPKVEGCWARYDNSGKGRMVPYGRAKSPGNAEVFDWLDDHWAKKHGLTRIEPVMSRQGVMAYTGKYLGKVEGQKVPEGIGRLWGVIGGKRWKSNIQEASVDNQEFFRIRRIMRRYREHKTGKKERNRARITGMNVFMPAECAERIKQWAFEERQGCPF